MKKKKIYHKINGKLIIFLQLWEGLTEQSCVLNWNFPVEGPPPSKSGFGEKSILFAIYLLCNPSFGLKKEEGTIEFWRTSLETFSSIFFFLFLFTVALLVCQLFMQ